MVVLGLGVTGDAVVRHRAAAGDEVIVVEDAPGDDAYRDRRAAAMATGADVVEHPDPDRLVSLVGHSDLLVPSPGVNERHPAIEAARQAGVAIRAEVDLASELATARGKSLVAVTGTNGKTTVTTLICSMLNESGIAATAAGNIGLALLDAVDAASAVLVAEVSSFQLAFTTEAFRPRVAVLLNVAPDHLDWHGSFERYAAAKARVFAHQGPGDVLVFNRDDEVAARLAMDAPSRRVAFSITNGVGVFHMEDGALVDTAGERIAVLSNPPFTSASHDHANALAATAAALEVGATNAGITRALDDYPRLHHRVARVGNAGGVQYYDDSKATNPHATLSAVRGFDRIDGQVVLVAGGRNKGLDLSGLRELAPQLRGVVAIGEASDDVEAAFAGAVPTARASSMKEAVAFAARRAQPGDVVLLSPACASFDWYPSYAARGDDFAHEVARLSERGVA
ncbi:MAG TPA: UDP-N-acetylmuramoyl-L-alanine--D-glutamate ligase [Acidimicrobiia bacterium]